MNYTDPILREIAAFSPLDVMLADIAVRGLLVNGAWGFGTALFLRVLGAVRG